MHTLKPRSAIALTVLFLAFLLPAVAAAQQGPGAAFFSYQCGSSSITYLMHGSEILDASFAEISSPLSQAVATGQNQFIKSADDVALYALSTNELQIHQTKDPDLTRYILPSNVCGAIYVAPTSPTSSSPITAGVNSAQALAMVELNGPGHAIAVALANAGGQVAAFVTVVGNGSGLALAQTNSTSGSSVPPTSSGKVHVVARGENLFRIALRYGTTVAILSQINGIADPTRIYIGEKIYLP